jgi:hypothetical protein
MVSDWQGWLRTVFLVFAIIVWWWFVGFLGYIFWEVRHMRWRERRYPHQGYNTFWPADIKVGVLLSWLGPLTLVLGFLALYRHSTPLRRAGTAGAESPAALSRVRRREDFSPAEDDAVQPPSIRRVK